MNSVKYIALLRGINVGGKNIIKMADLKVCLAKNGFENISTFIQSGNVLFDSSEKNTKKLENDLEKILSKQFKYKSKVLVRSHEQMKKVISEVPRDWKTRKDLRCYIAFIKEPITAKQAKKEVEVKEGIDFLKAGDGVLYMSTLLSDLTKSGINKIIGKKIYQDMTIRNYNTTKKLAELID